MTWFRFKLWLTTSRLGLIVHLIRGRPLMYRMHIHGGLRSDENRHGVVYLCYLDEREMVP